VKLLSLFAWLLTIINIRVKKAQKTKKLTKLKQHVRRHVKLTLVPHGANQYRPHLIRRYGLIVLLLFVVGVQAGYNFTMSGSVLGTKAAISTDDLLAETNKQREIAGVETLRVNTRLNEAAYLKAQDMLRQQYWAHVAPDGTTPWQWLTKAGYNYTSAGENLAKNFSSPGATMTAWMASPEHRENVLNARYSEVGFAVADGVLDGKPTTLIVALYGRTADASVAAAATPRTDTPASAGSMGILTRLDVAIQSMTPAALGSLFVLALAATVALLAHMYRGKLPKRLRQSWYRHHGLMKVGGMLSLVVVMVVLYSGGQI